MSGNMRRSERIQKNAFQTTDTTPKKQKTSNNGENKDPYCDENFVKELENMELGDVAKSRELFCEDNIDGREIYYIEGNNKSKNAMMQKALMCRESKQSCTTPTKKDSPLKKDLRICLTKVKGSKKGKQSKWNIKSPKRTSTKAKKEKLDESDLDMTDESDVNSDDKEYESTGSENSDNDVNKEKKITLKNEPVKRKESPPRLRSGRSRVADYHFETDNYFAMQSEKSLTSNHTLSRLKNPHLDEEKLQKLLANNDHMSDDHKENIQLMSEGYESQYPEWLQIMEEGFNVLLYGLGSKRLLINKFYKKMIADEPTLIINGFFPSLTIKEILDNIITELLGLETVPNQSECFDIIEQTMKKYSDDRIYLLIHNLDGGMLRSNKAQDTLSRLASIPNIHVLASVDHINAPLIWDNVKRARYNFFWTDVTTFLPYEAETSYESSLLVQKSGALALLSLQNVFASLTSNAKAIYILLVKYQLENNRHTYSGMAFKDLYQASREGFFVSSDQALRAQLTEFLDHKLVKQKRNHDGVEHLIIPLDDALLKQFLEQHDEA